MGNCTKGSHSALGRLRLCLHSTGHIVPQWLSAYCRDQEPRSCSIYKTECLNNANPAQLSRRIPAESLVFSSHGKAKEAGF